MKVVEDNEKNLAACRIYCGSCPSFKPNGLNTIPPHALFCSRGQSTKPAEEIEDKGCSCFTCPVFRIHKLEGGWFCMHGLEGRK